MTAGDIGAQIQINVGALGYRIPSGSTCRMLLAPGPIGVARTVAFTPVVVSADGSTATYVTQAATDIPSGGPWQAAVGVSEPSGAEFTSPPKEFFVSTNLALSE